jgi:hypothetical protein
VNVYSPQLSGILRIDLGVVCHLLALGQRLKSVVLYNGKMDENVSRSVVIGDKPKTFILVEPLYSTIIHIDTSSNKYYPDAKKMPQIPVKMEIDLSLQQSISTFRTYF